MYEGNRTSKITTLGCQGWEGRISKADLERVDKEGGEKDHRSVLLKSKVRGNFS